MTRIGPIVLAIPTFGIWSIPARRNPKGRRAIYSDYKDDSTRPSKPGGWDGWYNIRVDQLRRSYDAVHLGSRLVAIK